MGDSTKIPWADATINPAYGCTSISPACANCYAARMASRFQYVPGHPFAGTAKAGEWTGKINLLPERMEQALKWKRPRRIFVGSMTDLFHESVPFKFLDKVFAYMAMARQHTFMLLTKRPERMREYLAGGNMAPQGIATQVRLLGGDTRYSWPLPNVILGVTVENQVRADGLIPTLLQTPAAKRFVSIEPMLGPLDLTCIDTGKTWFGKAETSKLDVLNGHSSSRRSAFPEAHIPESTCRFLDTHREPVLDWVICGGETGPRARPMQKEWVFSLRDQCASACVPFFFKKWGTYKGPGDWNMPAGSLVEGVEHHEFPGAENV